MNKKRIAISGCVVLLLLTACAPTPHAIQTAIAQTQTALPSLTPTATATPTSTPTATINPCTNRGWGDITNYMAQYDLQEKNLIVGTSISTYLQSLQNYIDKINNVIVDSCTEHARQSVIAGLGNRKYGMQLVLINEKLTTEATTAMVEGMKMIMDAETELHGLGLLVTFP